MQKIQQTQKKRKKAQEKEPNIKSTESGHPHHSGGVCHCGDNVVPSVGFYM